LEKALEFRENHQTSSLILFQMPVFLKICFPPRFIIYDNVNPIERTSAIILIYHQYFRLILGIPEETLSGFATRQNNLRPKKHSQLKKFSTKSIFRDDNK